MVLSEMFRFRKCPAYSVRGKKCPLAPHTDFLAADGQVA